MTNRVITFFEKVGHDLKEIFTSTTWETKTLSTIAYVEPFVIGILSLADPAIAPLVSAVLAKITASLTTVKTIVQQGAVAPGSSAAASLAAELNSVKANLSALLADAQVKNSTKIAEITSAVDLVNGELDAVLSEAPAAA